LQRVNVINEEAATTVAEIDREEKCSARNAASTIVNHVQMLSRNPLRFFRATLCCMRLTVAHRVVAVQANPDVNYFRTVASRCFSRETSFASSVISSASRLSRSSRVTMPTSPPSRSTTGMRRTPLLRMV
jgi:hypothetical protein